jgi:ElaB/YqjD/DUF883 family membrane-anchored ribosome-binding protein
MAVSAGGTPNTANLNTGTTAGGQRETLQEELRQQGERVASAASDKIKESTSRVAIKAEEAMANVGEKMSTLAGSLREKAPKQGRVGSAVQAVASSLETSGQYLSEKKVSAIAQDVTTVVHKYPMQALWAGLGLGFIVGAITSKRRD